MSSTLPPPVRDDRTLTREEREAERSRQRALRFDTKPHAARVVARVHRARRERSASIDLGRLVRPSWVHPSTTRARTAPVKEYARRAFVRVRYAPAKKAGHWRAHGLYLEREGAQREGAKGLGFDVETGDVPLSAVADSWQRAGDDKMFKLVLSPEDGDRLDLVDYTRRFMGRFEQQVGKPIEWVAIDHHNTDQPHVHVLIRGRGLYLSPELIRTTGREIAQDEATRALGYRTPQEIQQGREREIEQRRFTGLDREIQRLAVREPPARDGQEPPGTWLVEMPTMTGKTATAHHRERRRQQVGRLQALETIGVAERVGHMTWRLDPGWDKALRELAVLQSRSTMLVRHRELLTDPRALPVVTKLQPGQRLTGRVLGTGLDDARDAPYLLIEGTDGRAHFLQQSPRIEDRRAAGELKPGALATIDVRAGKDGRALTYVADHGLEIPARGFTKIEIPAAVLDDDLRHREQQGRSLPTPPAAAGFAAHYQRQLLERDRQRRLETERKRDRGRTQGRRIGDDDDGIA